MSPPRHTTLLHRLEDAALAALLAHYRSLPLDRASAAAGALAAALGPRLSAHRTALRNLALAFPDWDPKRRRETALAMWRQLGATFAEFAHMDELNAYGPRSRVHVLGGERLDEVKASGRGAVFIAGHFANWEIIAAAIVQRGLPCHVTYRPANNPLVDRRINAIRRSYGVQLQSAKGRAGGLALLRALARGETVALMNDQKYSEGIAAPFFGHDAMTADGATRLALRFGTPLIPLHVRRLEGVSFEVVVHPEIELLRDAPTDVAVRHAINAINAFIESRVREAPEQWFWVHKRWPKSAWVRAGLMESQQAAKSA